MLLDIILLIKKIMPLFKLSGQEKMWIAQYTSNKINAQTHIDPNDLQFCEVAKQDGF